MVVRITAACIHILFSSAARFLQNTKESIIMYMAILVLVLNTYLPVYDIGTSFGWVPLMTYIPINAFFCVLNKFSSVGRGFISREDLGSISLLQFGATRKHLLWSLTWMIPICANCVHTRRLQCACSAMYFCAINAWLITRVTCQMINQSDIVLLLRSNIEKKCVF